jgi:putative tricarboxylic transport membrane protein
MLVNRFSASFFILLGLSLIYFVFPIEIEKLDYGWVRPQTLPNICAFLLITFGILHFIFPKGKIDLNFENAIWSSVFALVSFSAVFGFFKFGFIYTAPIFSLMIMLLIGEKRILWLSLGVILIPFLIWLSVAEVLGRFLP